MHVPDGFLNVGTALAAGALSAATVSVALRHSKDRIEDRHVPLAGLSAAFVFAAQMINFPVAAGTTGHLLGGTLIAVLLGPRLGVLAATVVVVVQALVFADGGITALGINVFNMAIVTAIGGYAVFRLLRRLLPNDTRGVVLAAGIASGVSVILSSMAFSVEWLFGATAPIAFDTVFGAMVGVHIPIAFGEGVVTALTVSAVLAARPDLVHGADGIELPTTPANVGAVTRRHSLSAFLVTGVIVTGTIAAVVSQFAGSGPDGLERVAADLGISGTSGAVSGVSPLADYAIAGLENPAMSLAIAGLAGTLITLAVGAGLVGLSRAKPAPVIADIRTAVGSRL